MPKCHPGSSPDVWRNSGKLSGILSMLPIVTRSHSPRRKARFQSAKSSRWLSQWGSQVPLNLRAVRQPHKSCCRFEGSVSASRQLKSGSYASFCRKMNLKKRQIISLGKCIFCSTNSVKWLWKDRHSFCNWAFEAFFTRRFRTRWTWRLMFFQSKTFINKLNALRL